MVRYTHAGFGASGPFDPAVRYTHASDLLALLDHLGIGKAVLAGLSFGGRVVTQAPLSAPDRIAGLVLLDSVLDGVPWDPGSAAASDTAVRQARIAARRPAAGRPGRRPLLRHRLQHPRLAGQLAEMMAGYPGQHWTGHDPHKQAGPPPIDTLEKLAMLVLVWSANTTCRASKRCLPCSPAASRAPGTTSSPALAT